LQSNTLDTDVSSITPVLTTNDKAVIVRRYLKGGESSGYRINRNPAEWQRFVLVIDEINRGNISKILGELITLLEEDKRVGMLNEQIVTLPYSREKFALPPNLYLLGTMNTADKSIALVDLALRRRFEFEELRPNFSPSVCTGLTDEMRMILTTLNQRISLRKDRDHRIGHAFFVNVVDEAGFNRVLERKIVPLLGEYFYGDWEGLRWVLNETGTGSTGFVRKIPGSGGDRAIRNTWQWYLDSEDETEFNALAVLKKNYHSSSEANSTPPVGDGE
jgi:5-methylcytosine-specific restriction endonuclease McrBC GTP-binding regulatory subunit McrB